MTPRPDLSLNEVEAVARKAARGAGRDWGVAEEAGRAARWLCAQGMDGCGALAALLRATDAEDAARMAPADLGDDWRAASGAMCPILAGASLSDCALRLAGARLRMTGVAVPALLLPFAAAAARRIGGAATVEWPGAAAVTDGRALDLRAEGDAADAAMAPAVTVRLAIDAGATARRAPDPAPRRTRAAPRRRDWDLLNLFAGRTYAPATEQSRLLGAGAGRSDND